MGRNIFVVVAVAVVALGAGLVAFRPSHLPPLDSAEPRVDAVPATRSEAITPLPQTSSGDAHKIQLGKLLFRDQRLSRDNTISCASCHDLNTGGDDGRRFPIGVGGQVGTINTPTVWNSGFNFRQFWNGRAETLEDQIDGPVENPAEMGSRWEDVVARLREDADLSADFGKSYPDGITRANLKDAIATFERALTTPDSRFDKFLRGKVAELNAEEQSGYAMFKSFGCITCHQGVNIGGNMYQRFGIMGDYFAERGKVTAADLGRFTITGEERDRYRFKVPSLRNISRTAPYFHDGSAATLEEAVRVMAHYQLDRTPDEQEVSRLVAFLRTLDGKLRVP